MSVSPNAETVLATALRLPREERALLAEKLLESLDEVETFEVSDEWRREIRRRLRQKVWGLNLKLETETSG